MSSFVELAVKVDLVGKRHARETVHFDGCCSIKASSKGKCKRARYFDLCCGVIRSRSVNNKCRAGQQRTKILSIVSWSMKPKDLEYASLRHQYALARHDARQKGFSRRYGVSDVSVDLLLATTSDNEVCASILLLGLQLRWILALRCEGPRLPKCVMIVPVFSPTARPAPTRRALSDIQALAERIACLHEKLCAMLMLMACFGSSTLLQA